MSQEIIPIRGHHLLCAPRFVGLGYSVEFTRNMEAVLARLHGGQAVARIVGGPDAICRACPHLEAGACRDGGSGAEDRRCLQDLHVLGSLGLSAGSLISWSEVEEMVRGLPGDVRLLCAGCRWWETCWGGLFQREPSLSEHQRLLPP